jgi:hypothetical protein
MDLTPIWRKFARHRVETLARLSPAKMQAALLKRMLAQAEKTRFGRDHEFSRLRDIAAYQAAVPLRDYDKFMADYWGGSFPHLVNLTWPGTISLFATTSGTSKRVPVSDAMVSAFRRATLETYIWHLARITTSRIMAGRTFVFGSTTTLAPVAPGVEEGFITGISSARMPWYLRSRVFPPRKISDIVEFVERADAVAAVARNFDVRVIAGMPSWLLLLFERLNEKLGLDRRIAKLWPDLGLFVHGGISFDVYRPIFDSWLDGLTADRREVYMASEGFIAIADRGPGEGLRLNLDMGMFFEFVPVDEVKSPQPRRYWIGNVEPGVDYALVLTTCAGLWSYVIGDIVRFVDTETPRVLITGRIGQWLSAFGERLLLREIDGAVADVSRELGLPVTDYSVIAIRPPEKESAGHHRYYVETPTNGDRALEGHFSARLDHHLGDRNHRYTIWRSGLVVGPPEVRFVAPGTFNAWMKRHNRLGGQNKVPRILTSAAPHQDLCAHLEHATAQRDAHAF